MTLVIPQWFYKINIKALIVNGEGKFLLIKKSNGLWKLPGWWLLHGEQPVEWLKRELLDEMNLEAAYIEDQPSYVYTWEEDGASKVNAIYYTVLDSLDFTPTEHCIDMWFFSAEEAKQQMEVFPSVIAFAGIYKKIELE